MSVNEADQLICLNGPNAHCFLYVTIKDKGDMFPLGLRGLVLHALGIPRQNWVPLSLRAPAWLSSLTQVCPCSSKGQVWISRESLGFSAYPDPTWDLWGPIWVSGENRAFPSHQDPLLASTGAGLRKQGKLDFPHLPRWVLRISSVDLLSKTSFQWRHRALGIPQVLCLHAGNHGGLPCLRRLLESSGQSL